ncbi:hypothetical protein JMJ77_0011392 [Colletotrichum scovillei]|uniref:Uncharacterized protein n=1 Tax=Colletotrichum scovillei TaxID=1209932 RepID=A0A9P7U5S2_9PEZI|nr:hypothetical protein JMJ78_0008081 [Colletotrichum scovillei]KAG7040528.1 hypothetical protein JMJ77_0011392 [Colletotrichum scovillei]KAG7060576.1 hypothetical protein JMJ76_0012149 [Colletotrichum scovillei]
MMARRRRFTQRRPSPTYAKTGHQPSLFLDISQPCGSCDAISSATPAVKLTDTLVDTLADTDPLGKETYC